MENILKIYSLDMYGLKLGTERSPENANLGDGSGLNNLAITETNS